MQTIDIKTLTVTELEAYAYKQVIAIEKETATLRAIQAELATRVNNPQDFSQVSGTPIMAEIIDPNEETEG